MAENHNQQTPTGYSPPDLPPDFPPEYSRNSPSGILPAARILIVRPSALGDVARTVPVLATLRKTYPDAKIDWLITEGFEDVIRHHPALNDVILFPRKRFARAAGLGEAIGWAKQLKRNRYDLVVDVQGLFRSGFFTWLTRAKRRVGFANAQEMGYLGYTEKYEIDRKLHTVERMVGLLDAAGFVAEYDMQVYVSDDDRKWWQGYLSEQGWGTGSGGGTGRYACIAPTARWLCKCWPMEKYVEIARRIVKENVAGGRVVLLAGPSEYEQVQPVLDALGDQVLLPKTNVGQMMAAIEGGGLMVCNDSAPLHVAVGLGRPVVTIFGPTNPGLVGPYGKSYENSVVQPGGVGELTISDYRKQRDDQGLIGQVEVDDMWQRIVDVLAMGAK